MSQRSSAASTRRTARPGWSPTAPGGPVATLLLSHGAGNGIDTRDLEALAAHLPRNGITVVRLEQPWRVAGRKVATPPATLDAAPGRRGRPAARPAPRWSSAAARPAPGRRPAAPAPRRGRAAWPWPSRCTRRAARRSRGSHELRGRRVPTLVDPGGAGHHGPPRGVPRPTSTCASCPAATTASRCRRAGRLTQDEAMAIVVEATLEWIVREVAGGGATGSGNDRRRLTCSPTVLARARTARRRAASAGRR